MTSRSLAVGVTSRTQVSSSLLCTFIRSLGLVVRRLACRRLVLGDLLWNTRRGHVHGAFRVVCVLVHLSLCRADPRCGRAIVATGVSKDDVV